MTTSTASTFAVSKLLPVLAFDSRGTPTVSCEVHLQGGGMGTAIVPSGASTGTHEAVERRDGGTDFGGRGVDLAIAGIRDEIEPAIRGLDARDQALVDEAMSTLDGGAPESGRLARLGANAVLAVSVATSLAAAQQAGHAPYRSFGQGAAPLIPLPMVNIFSGGAHATGALDVQDLLVIPTGSGSFAEGIRWVWEVRHAIGALLAQQGHNAQLVADEGGFGVALESTRQALELIVAGIESVGLSPGADIAIAIDVAASELHHDGHYILRQEGRTLTSAQMLTELAGWVSDYPIVSIEDPLHEDDWAGFHQAGSVLPDVQVLGDDFFVTDVDRLRRGIDSATASAVLVKPNQAGTLTAAHDVVVTAQAAGYATVLSARSGETEDSWLADLAVGWRTGQIKVGSLTRSERTAKWNRILRIEAELGADAQFAGRDSMTTSRQLQHESGQSGSGVRP